MTSFSTFLEARKPEEQVPCCKRCLDSHLEKEIPTKERYLEFLKEDTFNINLALSPKEAEIIYSALECLAREAKPINPKSHFEILRVIHLVDVAMLATVK